MLEAALCSFYPESVKQHQPKQALRFSFIFCSFLSNDSFRPLSHSLNPFFLSFLLVSLETLMLLFFNRSQPKSSIPFLWTLSTFGVILASTSKTEARVRAMLGAPRSGMWSECWNKKKEHVSLIISVNTNSLLMCLKAEEFVWVLMVEVA